MKENLFVRHRLELENLLKGGTAMISFESDYVEGAHEQILQRLIETNLEKLTGYGQDLYCDRAKEKIRKACECPEA